MGYTTSQVVSSTIGRNYKAQSHTLAGAMRKLADEIEERGLAIDGTNQWLSISRHNSDGTYTDAWAISGKPDKQDYRPKNAQEKQAERSL